LAFSFVQNVGAYSSLFTHLLFGVVCAVAVLVGSEEMVKEKVKK
jgi:hypothetical protein